MDKQRLGVDRSCGPYQTGQSSETTGTYPDVLNVSDDGGLIMNRKNSVATVAIMMFSLFLATVAFAGIEEEREKIDTNVSESLTQFYAHNAKNKGLADKAVGMLIFPRVTKAGVGIAGEHGKGVLLVDGKTVDYYNITSASVGLTLGMATRSEILMFMTQESLDKFVNSKGWKVGVDAGVALMTLGASGEYDTKTMQKPILGFVFGEKGLIGDLSLEGSKVSKA